MVRGGMGMLDDAIREHLELKRRRGADPGEVDREQAEALNPVGDREFAEDGGADADSQQDAPLASQAGTPVMGALAVESSEQLPETAELDMERAFFADDEAEHDAPGARDEYVRNSSAGIGADKVEHHQPLEATETPAEHTRTTFTDEPSDPPRER
jgi:hypothetical protein